MADGPGLRRRRFLAGGGGALAGAAVLGAAAGRAPAADASTAARGGEQGVDVVLHQGTDMAVTASPDGRLIVHDAVGVLWRIPAQGGPAQQLTAYDQDVARPDFSPDGTQIVFQSYYDGNF